MSQSKLPLIQYTRPTPPPGATIIPVIRRHREVKAFGIRGRAWEQGAQQREQLRINVLRKKQA